eukprot:gnl/Hemi2/1636_TR583_c0_g1_i3.p1 gnl/Hemi2/1636_TR583_c0_g1~~gnl/Hemi2/1636_TR583_c0_g1_i3.p1  ORF type:complete len:422 (-),score=97.31 gnl/Hemi2/1636_TR583_c0_g1_i3:92-1357(-)
MAGTLVSVDNRRLAAARLAFPNDESRIPIVLFDPQTPHGKTIPREEVDFYAPSLSAFSDAVGGKQEYIDAPVQLYRDGERDLPDGRRYSRAAEYIPLTWGELVFFRCLNQKSKSWRPSHGFIAPSILKDPTWDHTGKDDIPYFFDLTIRNPRPVYTTCDTFDSNCDECRLAYLGCKFRPATQECVEQSANADGMEVMAVLGSDNRIIQGVCPPACLTMNYDCPACVKAAGCKYFAATNTCGSVRTADIGNMATIVDECPPPLLAEVLRPEYEIPNYGRNLEASNLLQLAEQSSPVHKARKRFTATHKSHKRPSWLGAGRHVSLDDAGLVFLAWETKADRMMGCPAMDDATDPCSPAWRAANEDEEGDQCDCECAMFCSQDFDANIWSIMKREREARAAVAQVVEQKDLEWDDVEENQEDDD